MSVVGGSSAKAADTGEVQIVEEPKDPCALNRADPVVRHSVDSVHEGPLAVVSGSATSVLLRATQTGRQLTLSLPDLRLS